ncbi:MAG: YeeE/YedE family protein [Bdellovibrionales bacterium]|nr:YeeE/YedE family protein [Bdellovibrionales bacterium]
MSENMKAFWVGFIFALGLGISGMTQPQKVMRFLDVFGNWDPSLMFVMIGAIGVHAIALKLLTPRRTMSSTTAFSRNQRPITPALLIGATLFGIGWGLGGFCPGPALTSLGSFHPRSIAFVLSMVVGMWLFKLFSTKWPVRR